MLKKQKDREHGTISCNEHENYTGSHSFIFRVFSLMLLVCKTNQSRKKTERQRWKKKLCKGDFCCKVSRKSQNELNLLKKKEANQSLFRWFLSGFLFSLEKIKSRLMFGALCITKKAIFETNVSRTQCAPLCKLFRTLWTWYCPPAFGSFGSELDVHNIATW